MARLNLFCALVDEYEQAATAFPVAQDHFDVSSGPRPEGDRWPRVVRAMLLRKFVLSTRDEVYVGKVLASAVACLPAELGEDLTTRFNRSLDSANNWLQYGDDKGNTFGADILMKDLIYGGLLHGDYDKWLDVKETGWVTIDMATWQFTSGAERVVRALRDQLRQLAGAGHLQG